MIPVHPERGPDPRTLRWHLPAGTLATEGAVAAAPQPLAALLGSTVESIWVEDSHLDITLAPGATWAACGATVRSALLVALEDPHGWVAMRPPSNDVELLHRQEQDDAVIRVAAEAAITAGIGELARSHGGSITITSVVDGVLTVAMNGACAGCPAAGITLHQRLERELRATAPQLKEIRATEPAASGPRGLPVLRLLSRRPT